VTDLGHRVHRNSNQKIVGNPFSHVSGLKSCGRKVHPIRSGSKRNVSSAVHQNAAARATRKGQDGAGQIEQCTVRQILFADLNEVYTPVNSSADAGDQRSPLQALPVRDVVEQGTLSGKDACFSNRV